MANSMAKDFYNTNNRIHPLKFSLWVGMASITMMFGAFTSAYVVRQAAGNWLEFGLPNIFFISTLVLLSSSVTLHASYNSFKSENESRYRLLLILSLLLGITFLVLQYTGWTTLFAMGVDLRGNPSGSFLYIITGVHALHIIGGIAALIVAVINSYILKFKVTNKRLINFELTLHYWHFVDLLWVYLLIFLYLSR